MLGVGREPLKLPCPGQVRGPSPRLPGHRAGSRGVRLTPARFYKPGLRSHHTHTHTRAGAPSRVHTCTHRTPHTRVYTPNTRHIHIRARAHQMPHTLMHACVYTSAHTTHHPHTPCSQHTHHTHTHMHTHPHTPHHTPHTYTRTHTPAHTKCHTHHTHLHAPPTRIAGSLSAWMPCTLWTPSAGSPRPLTSVTGGERGRLPVLCVRLSGQRGTALRAVSGMQRGMVVVAGVVTQDLPTPLGCPLALPE